MVTTAARPLSSWLAQLHNRSLPVDPAVRARAVKALDQGELNSSALVECLILDPAQCWLIFAEASRLLASRDRDIYTLEHAVTLLGNSRIKQLLLRAEPLSAGHPHAAAYRRQQLQSGHAAWQARMWAEGSGRWHPDDTFLATLLAGVPLWAIALEAGDLLAELDRARAQRGATDPQQERAVLGCGLLELGAELARLWPLPPSARDAWRSDLGTVRRQWLELARAARWSDAPTPVVWRGGDQHHAALPVAAATLFAREADWNWYSRQSERLLRVVAGACGRPLATIVASTHQLAAHFSRLVATTVTAGVGGPLLTPGYRLCCGWNEALALVPPATVQPAAELLAALEQWLCRQSRTLAAAAPALAEALPALLGSQRLLILAVDTTPSSPAWQTLAQRGFGPASENLRFTAQPGTLFDQLARKAALLTIDETLRPRIAPHLPSALATATRNGSLLLASLAVAGRPAGALCVVYPEDKVPVHASERLRDVALLLGRTLAPPSTPARR